MNFGGTSAEVQTLSGPDTDQAFYMAWSIRAGDQVPLVFQVMEGGVPADLSGSEFRLTFNWGLGSLELVSGVAPQVLIHDQTMTSTKGLFSVGPTIQQVDGFPKDVTFHFSIQRVIGTIKKTIVFGPCKVFRWV